MPTNPPSKKRMASSSAACRFATCKFPNFKKKYSPPPHKSWLRPCYWSMISSLLQLVGLRPQFTTTCWSATSVYYTLTYFRRGGQGPLAPPPSIRQCYLWQGPCITEKHPLSQKTEIAQIYKCWLVKTTCQPE